MKQRFAILLCVSVLLTGCARLEPAIEEKVETETKTVQANTSKSSVKKVQYNAVNCYGAPIYIEEGEYPIIAGAPSTEITGRSLTLENLDSFPIKSEDMTLMERRMLCVEFFQFAKTALWISDDDFSYERNKKGTVDKMTAGTIYGGVPYIGYATGNVYRVMDYMDSETGVVDMSELSRYPLLFGNQCSVGSYWGWARVVNSADYDWTYNMVASRGFIPVGPMTYNKEITSFNEYSTVQICFDNGEQTMFKSYANMLPADGLISNDPSVGHVVMCTAVPTVVYKADDGTIDGANSFLCFTDQNQGWIEEENAAGTVYQHKKFINKKISFASLLKSSYVPFTFGEFLGTDPVEETVCTTNLTGETVTVQQLSNAVVTANYGISDIYIYVKNAEEEVLFYRVKRADIAGKMQMDFSDVVYDFTFGKYTDGKHTVEVVCQLGTGERPTIYTGTLVK